MASTENIYTGDGSTVLFSFTFPYLDESHIKVSVNGVNTTAYTLANATTVQMNSAPANGATVRIFRETNISNLSATFYPGSAIRASDLNDNFLQSIYAAEETRDITIQASTGGIPDGSISSAKLGTGVVSTDKIANSAVTDDKIGTGAVTTAKLAAAAVDSSKLATNAVATANIQDNAITNAKLGDQVVNTAELADSSVTAAKIADSSVTAAKLAMPYSQPIQVVSALNIDCSTGNYFTKTINANSVFTVSNVPSGRAYSFTLELTHTSGTVTWFSGVEWPNSSTPSLTTGKTHLFVFVTDDGGTRWRGSAITNYTN